jgi:hypothetical protein
MTAPSAAQTSAPASTYAMLQLGSWQLGVDAALVQQARPMKSQARWRKPRPSWPAA